MLRRTLGPLALLGALTALGGGAASAQAACPDENLSWRSGETARLQAAVVCLVNEERRARSIPTLVLDPRLTRAAQLHSEDMARRGYFDHNTKPGPDSPFPDGGGATPCSRAEAQGYDDCTNLTEDLGTTETPLTEVRGNIEDAEHCPPVLQGAVAEMGVGIADGRWTFDFGAHTREFTGAQCPDKLAREGGAKRVPSVMFTKPVIGRTGVTIPMHCLRSGDVCRLTYRVRRGGRTIVKRSFTLQMGQSRRLVVRPGKTALRQLARTGKVGFNVLIRVVGISEDLYDRDFVLRR
jgi:uncharacterized protein YkwD